MKFSTALGQTTAAAHRRCDRAAGRRQVDDGRRPRQCLSRAWHAGRGARRRPVIALQRGSAAGRPDPNGRAYQRPRCPHPVGRDAWPPRRPGGGGARRHQAARRVVLRPDRPRDSRRRAVGDRDRRGRRPDHRDPQPRCGRRGPGRQGGTARGRRHRGRQQGRPRGRRPDGAGPARRDRRHRSSNSLPRRARASPSWSRRSRPITGPTLQSAAPREPARRSCRWRRPCCATTPIWTGLPSRLPTDATTRTPRPNSSSWHPRTVTTVTIDLPTAAG